MERELRFPWGNGLTSSVGRRDLWEQLLLFSDIKGLTESPRELVGCRLITDLSQVVKKRQTGEREIVPVNEQSDRQIKKTDGLTQHAATRRNPFIFDLSGTKETR